MRFLEGPRLDGHRPLAPGPGAGRGPARDLDAHHVRAHLLAAAGFDRVAAIHDEFADEIERMGDLTSARAHRREGAALRSRAAMERRTAQQAGS